MTATGNTLRELIRFFYGVEDFQVSGGPDWLKSEIYDVEAKADPSALDGLSKLSPEQRHAVNQRMLQALLSDRFKLVLHRETKQILQYSLVVAEAWKLHPVQSDCPPPGLASPWKPGMPPPPATCGGLRVQHPFLDSRVAGLDGLKVPVADLVRELSSFTQTTVEDKTGLTGKYDIRLSWTSPSTPSAPVPVGDAKGQQAIRPSDANLQTALQQQLGLKLEPHTGPVELLIIDHAERPPETALP